MLDHAESDTHTHICPVSFPWISEQFIAEATTYTTNTRNEYPCVQRDSQLQT